MKSHHCLISESLLSFTCAFLFCQYCVIFSQKNAKGQVLFDKICEKIELAERDYFGLRYIDEKDGQVQ